MILKCTSCGSILDKYNDVSNIAFQWYRDDKNVNHTGFICTRCFTVYDCVGSLNIIASLSGKQSMKIINVIPPDELNLILSIQAKKLEAFEIETKAPDPSIYFDNPEAMMTTLLYILNHIADILIESGKIYKSIKRNL